MSVVLQTHIIRDEELVVRNWLRSCIISYQSPHPGGWQCHVLLFTLLDSVYYLQSYK